MCFHHFIGFIDLKEKTPCFKEGDHKLSIEEIIQVCVEQCVDPEDVCYAVPSGIRRSSTFVVKLKTKDYEDGVFEKDLGADDNGIYGRHACPSTLYSLTFDNEGKVTRKSQLKASSPVDNISDVYIIKRHYSWHCSNDDFKRTIVTVRHGDSVVPFAIIRYEVPVGCLISPKPHGNSRGTQPFYTAKASMLQEMRSKAGKDQPKHTIQSMQQSLSSTNVPRPSEIPRNRQQVYNQNKQVPNRGRLYATGPERLPDYNKLMMMLSEGNFLRDVSFSFRKRKGESRTHPRTFAATTATIGWIKKFCSGPYPKAQLQIDMTYHNGMFYATTADFLNPVFVYASNEKKHPTTVGALMTSTTKEEADYAYLAESMKKTGITTLTYVTDGEVALENAFEAAFPIDEPGNNHLRCFLHVDLDMKMFLSKLVDEQTSKKIRREILGTEFDGKRVKGLVDANDTVEFEEKYVTLEKTWPKEFIEWMLAKEGRKRSLYDTLKTCMSKDVRMAAGLGNPPNKCVNQRVEAMNRVIKDAASRRIMDQVTFHEVMYDKVFKQQEEEYLKAFIGYGEYRLSPAYQRYYKDPMVWKSMTSSQREAHVAKIFGNPVSENESDSISTKHLSISVEESGIDCCPSYKLAPLWKKANSILSKHAMIPLGNDKFCVTEFGKSHDVCCKGNAFTCSCKDFTCTSGICPHTLVVADTLGSLRLLIDIYKRKNNQGFRSFHNKVNKNAGQKPGQKKPRRGQQQISMEPVVNIENPVDPELDFPKPFQPTEIWHNNEPFEIVLVGSIKSAKRCEKCLLEFPKENDLINVPYDLGVKHRQRYQWPVYDSNVKPRKFLRMEQSKFHKKDKFYCVNKNCILSHHPYFWKGKLSLGSGVQLKEGHKKLLRENLHFEVTE